MWHLLRFLVLHNYTKLHNTIVNILNFLIKNEDILDKSGYAYCVMENIIDINLESCKNDYMNIILSSKYREILAMTANILERNKAYIGSYMNNILQAVCQSLFMYVFGIINKDSTVLTKHKRDITAVLTAIKSIANCVSTSNGGSDIIDEIGNAIDNVMSQKNNITKNKANNNAFNNYDEVMQAVKTLSLISQNNKFIECNDSVVRLINYIQVYDANIHPLSCVRSYIIDFMDAVDDIVALTHKSNAEHVYTSQMITFLKKVSRILDNNVQYINQTKTDIYTERRTVQVENKDAHDSKDGSNNNNTIKKEIVELRTRTLYQNENVINEISKSVLRLIRRVNILSYAINSSYNWKITKFAMSSPLIAELLNEVNNIAKYIPGRQQNIEFTPNCRIQRFMSIMNSVN